MAFKVNILLVLLPYAYTVFVVDKKFFWCTTHVGYVSMVTCTHTMKMWSYFIVNKFYRENHIKSKK